MGGSYCFICFFVNVITRITLFAVQDKGSVDFIINVITRITLFACRTRILFNLLIYYFQRDCTDYMVCCAGHGFCGFFVNVIARIILFAMQEIIHDNFE